MKFGLFYEQQLPRPWSATREHELIQDSLTEVELADRLGYDYLWAVEHHFLEEYAHSSAPEVFLAAASQRTKNIRIGHGVMLMVPQINHPARCAERLATLDLVSNGRVEWGTGESGSALELQGFEVPVDEKQAAWREGVEQCAKMLAMTPYPGFHGKYVSMPSRNVVPKPLQQPHPPLWMGCSNAAAVHRAAQLGMGALFFQFGAPEVGRPIVEDYYETFKRECVPIGYSVNPNVCFMSPLSIHADREVAIERGLAGYGFFGLSVAHHYVNGTHVPGRTNVTGNYFEARAAQIRSGKKASELGLSEEIKGRISATGALDVPGGIGSIEEVREHVRASEAVGIDQLGFVQAFGGVEHEHICEGLKLFASEIMAEFHERDKKRQAAKNEVLAPYIAAAMKRRENLRQLRDDEIPATGALPVQAKAAYDSGAPLTNWQRDMLKRTELKDAVDAREKKER
jgi:alkanesulfonate monooxygenase SsuD/methylene tetrahydromethanopterin reductase-like flavin-dependent oxidoreductase (luciferase family)